MAGPIEIVFYVGELLPGDVLSETFAGFTFEEIRSDLEMIYELNEPFDVFVNGELTSRKCHPLDYGDEVRILLHRTSGRENGSSVAENESVPLAKQALTVELQTSEATFKEGTTYPLDRVENLERELLQSEADGGQFALTEPHSADRMSSRKKGQQQAFRPDELATRASAAYLSVSVETLDKYVKSGLLARRDISPPGSGKPRYRFRVADLDRLKSEGYRKLTPMQDSKRKGRRPKRESKNYDHLDL
jgi:hypothetical protein